MATQDVDIRVNSKADLKGFKQADTAITKLNKNTKSFAKNFGLAFGTAAIVAFGKASVRAFAADEAAARRLSTAVENLGIGFANPEIAKYISNLERSAAIADDVLRPAFQALLTTTGSLTKSQELLNNAIQISRASGVDLATVSEDLAKGFVGQTRGLAKYNSGLSRAELQSKSFSEILGVLLVRSAGAADDYLQTTSYQMEVLSIATGNASEIIGGGLVDAFARIGGGTEASDAAKVIEGVATAIAKVTVATGGALGAIPTLIKNLKNLPGQIFMGFAGKQAGVNLVPDKKEEAKLTLTEIQQEKALAKLQAAATKREKELLALKNKQNAAAKLKGVIDKANLALNKGEGVFDLDKVQIAAALASQAEQLGKATSAAQQLQIANDTARLNVKRSMLELEDAIASKDEKAIVAATAKLNEDLKILSALTGQKVRLQDIQSILDGLKPKELIDQENLDKALAKIQEMLRLLALANTASTSKVPVSSSLGSGIPMGDYIAPISKDLAAKASVSAILEYAEAATERANAFALLQEQQNIADEAAFMASSLYDNSGALQSFREKESASITNIITVNTGIGDPNAIAEAIDQVLTDAVQRGTLRGYVSA